MMVKRNSMMETEHYEVGDILSFSLSQDEKVEAMAVKQEGDDMIFCFVDCLRDEYPMNRKNTNEGGYEASDLRNTLKTKILPRFPKEIMEKLVPFANGDLLRIPTEKEIFGENVYGEKEPDDVTQWEPMKLKRNRIAFQGLNGAWEWYWLQNPLRDVVSASLFAGVSGDGAAGCGGASDSGIGVRPAFKIQNL